MCSKIKQLKEHFTQDCLKIAHLNPWPFSLNDFASATFLCNLANWMKDSWEFIEKNDHEKGVSNTYIKWLILRGCDMI